MKFIEKVYFLEIFPRNFLSFKVSLRIRLCSRQVTHWIFNRDEFGKNIFLRFVNSDFCLYFYDFFTEFEPREIFVFFIASRILLLDLYVINLIFFCDNSIFIITLHFPRFFNDFLNFRLNSHNFFFHLDLLIW